MINLELLVSHANTSYLKSLSGVSRLTPGILAMEGMSGIKTRHLYNNLCDLPGASYLEVGPCMGSSFVSAIHKNPITAVAIDNWSQFGGSSDAFRRSVELHCPGQEFGLVEKDCFQVTRQDLDPHVGEVDIYLFDGDHTRIAHDLSVTHYLPFMSKYFVMVVDDWAWEDVKQGTMDGIARCGLKIHRAIEHISSEYDTGREDYWNGFGMFVCERTD
jgi:hypothetical protein